jgi:hypothetical protein
VKVLRHYASAHMGELMAEQQGSAAAQADLEEGVHNRLHGNDAGADRIERLAAGLGQSKIR